MKKKINFVIIVSCLLVGCLLLVGSIKIIGITRTDERVGAEGEFKYPVPPVQSTFNADAGKPYSGSVNEYIQFDGSGTYINPTGGAIYEWDFGDGTTGFGKYKYHRYSEPGVYYASLKVTTINDEAYMDDTVVYIDQDGGHLVPYAGCHYFADVDETITFDASGSLSNDPDAPITQYIWYFGDGEKAYGEQVTHSYDTARVYLVTLVTKDSNGNSRHDLLHADIGYSYTSIYDCFLNVDGPLEEIFLILLNKLNLQLNFLLSYFDAKIYTNYNGYEVYTQVLPLPKIIDVNNNGVNDIWIDQLNFLEVTKGPSLFSDDNTFVWYQFETTLSGIRKINGGDINAEDDFTICFQVKFPGQLLSYIDLDTPLIRVGYNSPPGEEMPESVTLTHIFKPYIIPGMFLNNVNAESIQQSQSSNPSQSPGNEYSPGINEESTTYIGETTPIGEETNIMEMGEIENQQSSSPTGEINTESEEINSLNLNNPTETLNLENGYYPEYALQLTSSGGGKISLVRMFLKSESEDDTGIILKTTLNPQEEGNSNMVFKVMKKSGIFHRGLKFEAPDNMVTVSIIRIDNGNIITELTTDLFWNQDQIRKIYWDDEGAYLRFESKVSAGLQDLYFYNQNPEMTLTLEGILFTVSGSFEFSLTEGIDLTGSAGFALTDLSFTTSNFYAGIIGTLELTISESVTLGLYKENTELGLKIGSTGELNLVSNCIYELNDHDITLHGDFTFGVAEGEIRLALDGDKLIFRLEKGPSLDIQALYFNAGDLTVTADNMNIGAMGRFAFEWIYQNQVTIRLGSGINLYLENVDLIYTNVINFNIDGSLDIESQGYVTLATDYLEASYSGSLELSDNFRFEINGISVEISGTFAISSDGILNINWDNNQISCSVSQNQQLYFEDFRFHVYPFTVELSSANLDVGCDLNIVLDKENKIFEIGGSFSFNFGGFSFTYEGNNLCSIGDFSVNDGGRLIVSADANTQVTIDFARGISIGNLVIEPSGTLNWLLEKFSVGSMSYSGDVYFNLEKSSSGGKLEFTGTPNNVEVTDLYLNMLFNAFKIDLEELSFDGEFSIDLENVNNINSAELSAYGSFNLLNLDSNMGPIDFDVSSINAVFTNSLLINLGNSATPSIQLNGGTQLDILNLDLTIGLWYLKIPVVDIDGSGDLTASWDDDDLTLNIDQNIQWDIEIDTTHLGDWETQGHLNGEVDISAKKSGDSGFVLFDIYDSGVQYNLKIIHGALTFELGTFNLEPGSVKLEWQKEQSVSNPGYFNIINSGVEGDLTAFAVTYDDGSNPVIEIELLNIEFETGNTYFTWGINYDSYIEMDRYSTIDCDAFKFKWGTNIITLDIFTLQTGKFRIEWDLDNTYEKILRIQNSISNLGPGITYEDTSQDLEISANIGGLNDDYETITLKWYKDSNQKVSGVYLDSGGVNLANLITFSAVKSDIGVKLTLGGLKVDGFYIKRDSLGDFEIGGKIYLVSNLTFSILKDDEWKDLTISWDLDLDGVGNIVLEADTDFISEEEDISISAQFENVDLAVTLENLTEYFKFGWDVDFDLIGYIQVDTNGDTLYQIGFEVKKNAGGYYPKWGAYIHASGLAAEDYQLSWDFSKPPGQWVLTESGEIISGQIDAVWIAWNGNWYNVLLNGQ